jgi:hypothetical protein
MSLSELALRDEHGAPGATRQWFETLLATRSDARRHARRGTRAHGTPAALAGVSAAASVRASIADDRDEWLAAADLVRRRYAWRGYDDDARGARCACAQPGCDHRVTLIASQRDDVVGTLTVGLDAPQGLLVDSTYRDEVDALRAGGRRLCEITRFAVDAEADSRAVLTALFGLAYLLTRALHNASDVLVEVNPRHVGFYRRLLGFCVASSERVCQRVKAPAVLLRLEMEELERRLTALGCAAPHAA